MLGNLSLVNIKIYVFKCVFVNYLYHIQFFGEGRIRNSPEPSDEEDSDSCVLSLGLFPGEQLELPGDDRAMFRYAPYILKYIYNFVNFIILIVFLTL